MNISRSRMFILSRIVLVLLALLSISAYAAGPGATSDDLLDSVLTKFSSVVSTWGTVITARATWLFWLLATVSMVYTFGTMALRKADLGEFFAEFIKFTLFTGLFWWLLLNGPQFATDIMMSMRQIGAEASGYPRVLAPSGIVDIGFDIFYKVVDKSLVWRPIDGLFGLLLSVAILVVFALIGANMLLLLVSSWIFAYAGVFILGFGGSRWTSEMAVGYFRSVLNIGLQLMTMILLVGIGKSFVDQYYAAMSSGITLKELGVMTVVAAVLLFLVAKVPPQIGALAGGTTGDLGSNFGIGAAVGAAAMGAAAIGSAGSMLAAAAASGLGGAQALMAAFSKANSFDSSDVSKGAQFDAGSDRGSVADSSSAGPGPLAAAMGDSGSSSSSFGSMDDSSLAEAVEPVTSKSSPKSNSSPSPGGAHGGAQGAANNGPAAIAAKVGRVAMGTAANLAQGVWDVSKEKLAAARDSTVGRAEDTAGGKIAAAIKARGSTAMSASGKIPGDDNGLSAGDKSTDPAAEVAAFRDRGL